MHVLVFWFSILWPLSHGKTWTRFVKCLPCVRHSRVGGNPVITRTPLDSRLRGNDLCVAHAAVCHWIPACAGMTYETLRDTTCFWDVVFNPQNYASPSCTHSLAAKPERSAAQGCGIRTPQA